MGSRGRKRKGATDMSKNHELRVVRGAKLVNESHPSKYCGSNEDGDGYRDSTGKKVGFSIAGRRDPREDPQPKML